MKYCPYDWAKDKEDVKRSLGYWLKEDAMWKDVKYNNEWSRQTGGFSFKITKTGKRYMETIPTRIYID